MWLGRGTGFPLVYGWHGGILAGMAHALPARAQSVPPAGLMGEVPVSARPAGSPSSSCRDTSADSNQRNLFRDEAAFFLSALARGPPLPRRKALLFPNGFVKSAASTRRNR